MAGSNAAREPDSPKHDYAPRRPTETVLYAIVHDHLEAFLAHARESYERALPRYVEQAFRAYLTCGVFAHGFLRLHCDACHLREAPRGVGMGRMRRGCPQAVFQVKARL